MHFYFGPVPHLLPLLPFSSPPLPLPLFFFPCHFPFPLPPQLPEGKEMVMPGDDTDLTLTLMSDIPLEEGQRFTLRECGKTVGIGVVTGIIE